MLVVRVVRHIKTVAFKDPVFPNCVYEPKGGQPSTPAPPDTNGLLPNFFVHPHTLFHLRLLCTGALINGNHTVSFDCLPAKNRP